MKFTGIYYSLITVLADRTGLEPATSAVTGQHSNQLNYRSIRFLSGRQRYAF